LTRIENTFTLNLQRSRPWLLNSTSLLNHTLFRLLMKFIPRFALILLAMLLLSVSGCGGAKKTDTDPDAAATPKTSTDAPSVSLADMKLDGIKGLETIFRLHLRVINPNEEPLEISSVTCALKVKETSFAKGISKTAVTVPSSGTALVSVLVYAGMTDMMGSVIEVLQQKAAFVSKPLKYELTGSLGLRDKSSIPLQASGTLPPQ
jgi:LEA14-like dessication related protein